MSQVLTEAAVPYLGNAHCSRQLGKAQYVPSVMHARMPVRLDVDVIHSKSGRRLRHIRETPSSAHFHHL
eukprot:SAG31_NODE_87_length_26728_cov_40.161591_6_plen_69_part_00